MHPPRCIKLLIALFLVFLPLIPSATAETRQALPGPQIHLLRATFDPLAGMPALPPELTAPAGEEAAGGYALVQFRGPILPEWKEAAAAAGAELLDYIPDYAFIARLRPGAAEALAALPAVRWVGPFHPAYRLSPALDAALRPSAQGMEVQPLNLRASVFPGEDLAAVERALRGLGAVVSGRSIGAWGGTVRLQLPAGALAAAARIPGIAWLEPVYPKKLTNNVARTTMGVTMAWSRVAGLYGTGQTVAVADTGLDTGSVATLSADFAGRLTAVYALGRPGDWSDHNGHGTHVAGSVLGNGRLSGSNPDAHSYTTSFAGVAPEARLVFQSIEDSEGLLSGLPDDLNQLFQEAYNAGARIHTNSWGGETGDPSNPWGGYDLSSRQADQFAWAHKDATLLFAAGNSGTDGDANGVVDPDSIGSPGTAKDVITIGASENYRPGWDTYGNIWPEDFPAPPIALDPIANNVTGLAAFSSRGPTDDGRIKPDLVAPGTNIISARSHDPAATGTGWGVYDANYLYMGGTSMATPLTAGAAALVRQWYMERQGVANPSGALIKATLINGAIAIAPGQYGSGSTQEIPVVIPNTVAGWGRVNVAGAIAPDSPTHLWYEDHSQGLSTGNQVVYRFTTSNATRQTALPAYAGRPLFDPPLRQSAVVKRQADRGQDKLAPSGDLLQQPALPVGEQPVAAALAASGMELIQNPGFETGSFSPWIGYGSARVSSDTAHSGSRSGQLTSGDSQWGQIYQSLAFPSNIVSGTLTFWLRVDSQESYPGYDTFAFAFRCPSDGSVVLPLGALDATLGTGQWRRVSYLFDSNAINSIKGQTLQLVFAGQTDSSLPSHFYIDDVSLLYETSVPGGRRPFRVTLAWTDYPGAPNAAKALVNDLDLEIVAPNGTHYYGNRATAASRDRINNVESVWLEDAPAGTWQVIVQAQNVPQGPQPYALVISGSDLTRSADITPTSTQTPSRTPSATPQATSTPSSTPRPPSPTPTACAYPPCATPTAESSLHLPLILKDVPWPTPAYMSRGNRLLPVWT